MKITLIFFYLIQICYIVIHSHKYFFLFYHRKRRDASREEADESVLRELRNFKANFHDIYKSDSNWCGLRLSCELSAKAGSALDEDEKMIISFFK